LLASKQIAQRAIIPTPVGWIPALLALLSLIAMYLWRRR
jgi:hypothetical protein